ncbi:MULTISPECIES: GFA family protein [Pseudomonas]|uniref:GFA family protein n=1 Tax=Pseudomonas nitroreducens TaxID=46680 RepID=A0A6G6IWH9_PSENT|nr:MULTISPECIES: GFA family protein [Pseudomonas]MBG6290444.1 GFA family protein [Pseudomonas nitroreducens]MCJ1877866.1 GFA family protein [Pseudomonas nitroreducens]MCJ1894263.1 GFA family protein [Pseudomonas nitroreducens]MDG9855086.1 GFA family protein [Pseudomonas nitroreducens]MDH1074073.1 GFA family protein [Pseudomonas nitroreducens]
MHSGGCLCGAVRFEIDGELAPVQVCHCSQCRKAQGGPFATNIPVDRAAFRLLGGESQLGEYRATADKKRVFCRTCGSPIYSARDALPETLRVRAGTLDEPVRTKLEAHYYVASRASWWPLEDNLPRHEGAKPG